MHNGVVAHFNLIRREICAEISHDAIQLVKGTTDSEHFAALVFTYLEDQRGPRAWEESHPPEDVKASLERAISTVIAIQKQVVPKHGLTPEASSLNIAITDGIQLITIRFRNHAREHPPSLYFSTRAGISLNRKFPGHPDKEGDNGGVGPCGPAEGGLWAKYLLASRGHRCGMASMRGVLQCTGAAWTQWVGPCLSSWMGGTAAPGFPSIGAPTACVEGAM